MKTLTSSAFKIIINNYNKDTGFLSSKGFYVNKPESLLLPTKKLVNARFLQHMAVPLQPVSSLPSSEAQSELGTGAQTPAAYESKNMHVKFQLQKKCLFGEQFFLVGDDPMLGLWDPTIAIPLEWSDEHIWNVELDIPMGKTIQFKFILRESSGEIIWQPGPDRIFQTWETKNAITVFEDWSDAEKQKIIKEDSTVNSKMLVANNNMKTEEDVLGNNGNAATINNLVAQNIGYPEENPVSEASNKMFGEEHISQPEKGSLANKNVRTEDVLGNNGRAATIKNLASTDVKENLITHEGDAVLVPGLTPLPTSDEGEIQDSDQKSIPDDASIGINEALNYNSAESDEKHEREGDTYKEKKIEIFNNNEQQLDREQKQMPYLAKQEQEPVEKPFKSNFMQDDIQWGRRTLRTFLTNLGLL